jgi:hypothetical protein
MMINAYAGAVPTLPTNW